MTRTHRTRVALGVAIACALLAVAWRVRYADSRGHGGGEGGGSGGCGGAPGSAGAAGPRRGDVAASGEDLDALAPEHTVRDRAVRDAVRERIVADWSRGDARPRSVTPHGVTTQAVAKQDAIPERDTSLDRAYIQDRIRSDFVPMAQECYEEMLGRRPGEHVRITMQFRIVADPRHGGIVDDARAVDSADGGEPIDAELATCMRESMLAMAFRPPGGEGGAVTVHYPFVMSPGDDEP